VLRVLVPLLRVAVALLVLRVAVALLVLRVVVTLLVERDAVVAVLRDGADAVVRLLVLLVLAPVERVTVAVVAVERVLFISVLRPAVAPPRLFTSARVAPAVRAEFPVLLTASARDAAVWLLPYVRLLVMRSLPAALLPAAIRAPPSAALAERTLPVPRISRALTMPVLRLRNERSGFATAYSLRVTRRYRSLYPTYTVRPGRKEHQWWR
jgi:hypothetical protein